MTLKRELRQIDMIDSKVMKLAARAAPILAQQRELQTQSVNAKRAVVSARLEASGLFNRPVAEILSVLEKIRPGATLARDVASGGGTDQPVGLVTDSECSTSAVSSDDFVIVQISKNASTEKLALLEHAGFRWHGKLGIWRGRPDAARIDELREMFGDRLTVPAGAGAAADNGAKVAPEPSVEAAGPTSMPATSGQAAQAASQDDPTASRLHGFRIPPVRSPMGGSGR